MRATRVGPGPMGTAIVLLMLLGTLMLGPSSARAKTTVEQLQKEIRQRDAMIRSLVRRVENLERQMGSSISANASPTATAARPATRSRAAGGQIQSAALEPDDPELTPTTPGRTRSAPSAEPTQQARASSPAPGQFEVSEDDAERALERTLVATGNLLVPKGFAEIEPLFSYLRRETPNQILFNLHRNEFAWALAARFGLPWEAQFEVGVPYNLVEQQVTDALAAPARQVSSSWGNSFGDLTVGLAKTIVHESGWIPDLLGRITYEIPTGPQNSNRVPLPSGQNKLGFALTGLKRQDPLVFVAGGGYTKAFQSSQINPGDQINFQTGVFLATSPETTLRGVLQQTFQQDSKIYDVTFRGSNSAQSVLTFGASTILGRSILADLQVGVGLTNSAPKYSVILSSTYRFGVPGL